MNEAKFMHSFNGECYLRHVKPRNIFREYLVLNEHCHQITTRKEFHKHVEECRVLEGRVQLDNPRAVRFCQNVSFRSNMGELILFELRAVRQGKEPMEEYSHTISDLIRDLRA